MIRGLLAKSLRETWLVTALAAAGLAVFERVLTFVLPQVSHEIGAIWLQMPLARTMLGALLGIDVDADAVPGVLQALVWVHPVVLAVVWAHAVILGTRFPAGEVDRGTADLLLGLPVGRRRVLLVEALVAIASAALVIAAGAGGYALGAASTSEAPWPPMAHVLLVLVNLLALVAATGAVSLLVSSLSNRRGRAIGIVVSLLLASFLLDFIAGFWPPAERVAFLGVLEYYQPALVLARGDVPWSDLAVLLGVTAVAGAAALEITARRSIVTM